MRYSLDPKEPSLLKSTCSALNGSQATYAQNSPLYSIMIPLVNDVSIPAGSLCIFSFPVTNPTQAQSSANVSVDLRYICKFFAHSNWLVLTLIPWSGLQFLEAKWISLLTALSLSRLISENPLFENLVDRLTVHSL